MERLGFNQLATNMLFMVISPLADILSSRTWGRCIDRWGRRPILIIATLGTAASILPWFFVTRSTPCPHFIEAALNGCSHAMGTLFGRPDWTWVAPGVPVGAYLLGCLSCFIGGASWSGVNLAQNNVILGFSDRPGGSKSVASATVLISFGGLLGGLAGGIITYSLRHMSEITCFLWGNFHICFLVSLAIRVGAVFWLWDMPDPGAAPVRVLLQQARHSLYNTVHTWSSYPLRIFSTKNEEEGTRDRH